MSDYHVDRAYSIKGPEDAKDLYTGWADTYDTSFTEAMGYIAPREIAAILIGEGAAGPILDVGAGTGAVAEHLPGQEVDGIDISAEMLEIARGKGLYRKRIVGDLTRPLKIGDATYGAVISAGTFTHGHVGPECLPELLRVTRPGGVFVCGTRPQVYDEAHFGSTLALLSAGGRIGALSFREIPLYEGVDHDHAGDRGLVMVFRRL